MEKYTDAQKKLIGACIGLARSFDETNADCDALKVLLSGIGMFHNEDEEVLKEQTEKLHKEKSRVAPDCSVCKNPCGKTFDYDLDGLELLEQELVELKYELLEEIMRYAERVSFDGKDYREVLDVLGEALFSVGYDWFTPEQMREKIGKVREKILPEENSLVLGKQ